MVFTAYLDLFLCQKAIAQFFFPPHCLYPPPHTHIQNDYCNKCTAGVCKLNQVEEEVSFQLSGQRESETCLDLCSSSFTVVEVFACTVICLIQLSPI